MSSSSSSSSSSSEGEEALGDKAKRESHEAEEGSGDKAKRESHEAEEGSGDKAQHKIHEAEEGSGDKAQHESHEAEDKAQHVSHEAEEASGDKAQHESHEAEEGSGDKAQHESHEAEEGSGDKAQHESHKAEEWSGDKAQHESHEAEKWSGSDDVQHEGQMDKEKVPRLFGRQKPVHSALGGGKPADVILWRNKQTSGAVLTSATVIWLLFEWIDYHLIPFICHFLILSLASSLLWSNLSCFINKSSCKFPEVVLSEDVCNKVALTLRDRCNKAINALHEIALGRDVKKLLRTMFALWIMSIVGSWVDFLTLVYIMFVMMLTMPILYERHEDRVDSYARKAKSKLQKQYTSFDERVLQRLPKVPFRNDNKTL